MREKINKGVSMVEILISIAIFTILMVPIISGIISSMNSTTDAKTLQYRNEFAENMMEYVKQDSLDNILSGTHFANTGSYYDATKSVDVQTLDSEVTYTDSTTGAVTKFPYEKYTLTGKVNLGTKHETYSYIMEISNQYYAQKEADTQEDINGAYVNPNNLALGVVEDIDHTKVALINGTLANYDATVSNAFLTKKIDLLQEHFPEWYRQYVQQADSPIMFTEDTAKRVIKLKVSGNEDDGYKVTCTLKYKENSVWNGSKLQPYLNDYYIEYIPFEYKYAVDPETNKAKLPNIYLMYNVCLYNGRYSPDDYIAIDTSEVTDDTKVNVFIVETAETYSSNILSANPDLIKQDDAGNDVVDVLYNTNITDNFVQRNAVKVHLAAVANSKLSNLSVYHNFDVALNNDMNKKNEVIYYQDSDANLFAGIIDDNYIPLKSSSGESVANFGSLDTAQQESRGLYEVKIWLIEGDDPSKIDTSSTPIMTGTKGGDES